jgi:excisionase family DNA binding protein
VKLLTVAEAAEILHLSASTVRSLCIARKLRHERHGLGRGVIRIPPDAIEEYRQSVTVTSAAPQAATRKPSRRAVTLKHLRLRDGG